MRTTKEQVDHLKNFVTDEKNELFGQLIRMRTDYVTVVLEDLYQSHNQSAVMRSADCFGLQEVHLIENRNVYDVSSTVSRGAREWLTLHRYNDLESNTQAAIDRLRGQGYRIVATTPHTGDVLVDELDLEKGKMAFFFGTELSGLSDLVLREADEYVKVPMYGFTESLNVSVSAALVMYSVMQRLHKSNIDWHLSVEREAEVLLQWYKKSVKAADEILERFNGDRTEEK